MRHESVWTATADRPEFPRLRQDLDVDVAVVGGGLVGLTTALLGTEPLEVPTDHVRADLEIVLDQLTDGPSTATPPACTATRTAGLTGA